MISLGFGEKLTLIFIGSILFTKYSGFAAGLSFVIAMIFIWLRCHLNKINKWKKLGIPGPEPNFLFGNTFHMLQSGAERYDIENNRKYGNVYGLNLIGKPTLMITNLEMIRHICIKDFAYFTNRPNAPHFEGRSNILSYMILTLRDQRWKDVRSLVAKNFSTAKLKLIFSTVAECTAITTKIVECSIDAGNEKFDTRKVLGNLVMDIIAKSAFGLNINLQMNEKNDFMLMANKVFNFSFINPRLIFMALFPNITSIIRDITGHQIFNNDVNDYFISILRKAIKKRIKRPEKRRNDFLQMVIDTSEFADNGSPKIPKKNGESIKDNQKKLTKIETIAQCFLFLVAGFETTTTTLQCAFYSLAVNQNVQEKAFEEVTKIIGDKECVEYEHLSELKYVEQVILETLRMYPPIPRFDRQCASDITIEGIKLEKHQALLIPIFALHYDERHYKEPYKFNPDRFSANEFRLRDPLVFAPFGHGPRHCIGMRFAQMNARMIIASLIREFKFTTEEFQEGTKLQLKTVGFTKPLKPIFLKIERRKT